MHSVPSRFHISFPQHGSGFGNMQNPKSQINIHFHLICSQVPQPTYSWIHPDTCQLGNPTTDMLQLLFWANIAQFIQRRSYTTKKLKAFLWIFVFLFLWVENLINKKVKVTWHMSFHRIPQCNLLSSTFCHLGHVKVIVPTEPNMLAKLSPYSSFVLWSELSPNF